MQWCWAWNFSLFNGGINIKTLIELFDECAIENVITAAAFKPERIVYIGYKDVMTDARRKSISRFFKMRNIKSKISYEVISKYNYSEIKNRINDILDRNEECVLDLTGGTELVLTAMGALIESRSIPALQIDIPTGRIINIKGCEKLPPPEKLRLSIEEYVALNGGAVITDSTGHGSLSLKDEFLVDIETAWKIRQKSALEWNSSIYALQALQNMGEAFGISAEISLSRSKEELIRINEYIDLLKPLSDSGLIKINKASARTLNISYKNMLVHNMLLKSGNIFELYTYAAAAEISRKSNGIYSDIGIGVFMDWDGVIHSYNSAVRDTVNEVDVVLIKGAVPVFISCKSGDLKKEALYELDTVANKFGGKYAKKIIVTAGINKNEDTRRVILQRAKDMGISIISDSDVISKSLFIKLLIEKTDF